MIKYRLKELIAKKEFEENRKIKIEEIVKQVGISRSTLSKIANSRGDYSTRTEYIEHLCRYFKCTPNDIMILIPDPTKAKEEP